MQETTWRFLDTGKGSAVFNMALDEAVMRMVNCGLSSPAFRVYGWKSSAITVGYSQSAADVLDCGLCRADGIDIAKRPTGGRAVFHVDEVAYAVVARADDRHFGGTVMETYRLISRMLCKALNAVGVGATVSRGQSGRAAHIRKNSPCFASASKYEITCAGKKLVGSAQRRLGCVFLQHGSILTGPGQERIVTYYKDTFYSEQLADYIARKSINMKDVLGVSFSENMLKTALFNAFRSAVDGNMIITEPSYEELKAAKQLVSDYESCNYLTKNSSLSSGS